MNSLTPLLTLALSTSCLLGCANEPKALAAGAAATTSTPATVTHQQLADALHAVMESDRTVYTKNVVNRLQNKEKIIKASEHWEDDKALPLPAQMFRMGAELASKKNAGFTYSLLSSWPVTSKTNRRRR